MTRKRISVLAGAAVIAAAAIGTGAAIAASSSPGQPAAAASSAAPASSSGLAASAGPDYSWYQSMMSGSYGGMMMGGRSAGGWMMSEAGYQWMTGGVSAPGCRRQNARGYAIRGRQCLSDLQSSLVRDSWSS